MQVDELFSQADWEGSGQIDFFEFESVMLEAYKSEKSEEEGIIRVWAKALKGFEDRRNRM